MLNIIFLNIMTNAIKYNKIDGSITINESIIHNKNKIDIIIKDTGIGIADEEKDIIFKPFYRSGNVSYIEGNGLGLSIVKKYMKEMNSDIRFTSKLDEGSSFIITLNYYDEIKRVNTEEKSNKSDNFIISNDEILNKVKMKRILYVEDDIISQCLITIAAEKQNISVTVVTNIKSAYIEIEKNETLYDLFLIDLNFSEGSGFDVLTRLNKKNLNKIMILTADTNINTRKKLMTDYGIKYFQTKPYNIKLLIKTMNDIINNSYL